MTEPVLLGLTPALITGAITAIANVLKTFGIVDITDEQVAALNGAAVAIMLILAALGTIWARSRVTPVASPVLPPGTVVNQRDPSHADTVVQP